jgi:hypothetical protein
MTFRKQEALLTNHLSAGDFLKFVSARNKPDGEPLVNVRPSGPAQQSGKENDDWSGPCGNGEEVKVPARTTTDDRQDAGKGRLDKADESHPRDSWQ